MSNRAIEHDHKNSWFIKTCDLNHTYVKVDQRDPRLQAQQVLSRGSQEPWRHPGPGAENPLTWGFWWDNHVHLGSMVLDTMVLVYWPYVWYIDLQNWVILFGAMLVNMDIDHYWPTKLGDFVRGDVGKYGIIHRADGDFFCHISARFDERG